MLRHAPILLAFLLLAAACDSTDDPGADTSGIEAPEGYELVWHDEFESGDLLDPGDWTYDVGGHGWGNQELQHYTARRAENARLEDGSLVITAIREDFDSSDYTSARVKTQEGWTYGWFEARAKLPEGRGTWPAIWMLPNNWGGKNWPLVGEIDIMEHVGYQDGVIHGTVHTGAYNHMIGTQRGGSTRVPSATDQFHVYAIEWTPEQIRWYVDGTPYYTFRNETLTNAQAGEAEWPFDKDFHWILNIAVGGTWGGSQGVDASIWPQEMEVDYVRVFQKAD
jgi:licheninase